MNPISIVIFTSGKLSPEKEWLITRLSRSPKVNLKALFVDRYQKKRHSLIDLVTNSGLWNTCKYHLRMKYEHYRRSHIKRLWSYYERLHPPVAAQGGNYELLSEKCDFFYFPKDLHEDETRNIIQELEPDLGIIIGGRILSLKTINLPVYGSLNLHVREVPRYRGGGAFGYWELLDEMPYFGLTVHRAEALVDAGAVVAQKRVKIDECDTLESIANKALNLGVRFYLETILHFAQSPSTIASMPQDLSKGKTYYTDIPGQYLYKIERRKIIKEMEVYKRKQWRLNLQLKFSYAANYHKLNKMRRNFVKSGDAPIVVLYYHRVANVKGHKINLPLENFAEQIDHITKYYEIVSLDEAHKRLSSGYNPDVAVAITFDDGYQSDLITSIPYLETRGVPATYFVCPGLSREGKKWLGFDLMSSDEIVEANKCEHISIGSHTMSHADCSTLDAIGIQEEIVESKIALQRISKEKISYFAFP